MTDQHPPPSPHSVLAVIPARYASSRFPGKPLVHIQGKPMIQHVWERANQVNSIERVVIATDDVRIQEAAQGFGAEVIMTSPSHPSGTDRIWEAANQLEVEYPLILNLQGDEPFMDPQSLEAAIDQQRQTPDADIVTLVTPIDLPSEVFTWALEGPIHMIANSIPPQEAKGLHLWLDPNIVKATMGQKGRIMYFSRAPIPFVRGKKPAPPQEDIKAYRHLGLYLFKRKALEQFTNLPPSALEQMEQLEQLRAMEAGMAIYAAVVDSAPIGVDTPDDLERLAAAAEFGTY